MTFNDLIKEQIAKIEEAAAAEANRAAEEALKRRAAIAAELPGFEEWRQSEEGDRSLAAELNGGGILTALLKRNQFNHPNAALAGIAEAIIGPPGAVRYQLKIWHTDGGAAVDHPDEWTLPDNLPTPEAIARIIGQYLWRRGLDLA